VRRVLADARGSLARFPSERALIDVVERVHQPDLADAGLNPVAEMAMSAATPPGVVLRNPRLAACARILASW